MNGDIAAEPANRVDMDRRETAEWRKVLADLEAAAATFHRAVNLIS
ncbi:hypothetical protein [Nonomuraea sp. NPDC050786]